MEIKTNINQIPNYQAPIQAPQGGDNDFQILIDGPLKSHAMLVACSNCKKMVQSNIQTEFNWGNYGVYYFCGTFPWILFNFM